MELTIKQQKGLELALQRYKDGEPYTVIAGYAGSGKSTLVRFIIEALNVPEEKIVYTSFTGKATQVLQKKGNKNVSTLHKLLFNYVPLPEGGFARRLVRDLDYDIIVVDECSMVPKELVDTLLEHRNKYVIFLGDPGQLPPIDKNSNNHLLDNPHIFLDEVMRQAAESEIIQLTMKVRNGEEIPYMKGKEVQVISREELNTGMLLWADQVLVATNATRLSINNQMRELLGRGEQPEDGDKVICLRNYWDVGADTHAALINGTIGTITNPKIVERKLPYQMCTVDGDQHLRTLSADFISDSGDDFGTLSMDNKQILEGKSSLDWKASYRLSRNAKTAKLCPLDFTYGYAITCWKAQGSEWDNVLVIEEKFPFDKEEHKRFLYTALTRAAKKVVLVRQ